MEDNDQKIQAIARILITGVLNLLLNWVVCRIVHIYNLFEARD